METNALIIKKESIERFFVENCNRDTREIRNQSIYNLMQDEILIKRSDLLKLDGYVEFHMEDESYNKRFPIEHIYSYSVKEYDDISFKLVLFDFNVKPIKR